MREASGPRRAVTIPGVKRLFLQIFTAIQLTRLTMAFGVISDVWFVILFTRAAERYAVAELPVHHELPLWQALLVGAVVAICLFAYGTSLNDVLDVRHDTAFSPDRPIPAGRIKLGQAIVVTVGMLIFAMLGAATMGSWSLRISLFIAAGVLFYNAAGKYIPGIGIVTLGLIHAAHMLIPNYQFAFTLPIMLVLTHTMAIGLAVHVLEEKRPRLSRRSVTAIGVAWVFWSAGLILLGVMREGLWPEDAPLTRLVYPVATILAFLVVARWKTMGIGRWAAAEKLKRYGAMWQSLYGAAWLMTAGLEREALWIGGFAVAGFTAMTLVKEITGLTGRPISYRG